MAATTMLGVALVIVVHRAYVVRGAPERSWRAISPPAVPAQDVGRNRDSKVLLIRPRDCSAGLDVIDDINETGARGDSAARVVLILEDGERIDLGQFALAEQIHVPITTVGARDAAGLLRGIQRVRTPVMLTLDKEGRLRGVD